MRREASADGENPERGSDPAGSGFAGGAAGEAVRLCPGHGQAERSDESDGYHRGYPGGEASSAGQPDGAVLRRPAGQKAHRRGLRSGLSRSASGHRLPGGQGDAAGFSGQADEMAGGNPVIVEAKQENNFKVTVEQLEEARTSKSKILLLNSPSNPTGMIYSKEELTAIGEWALAHDLLILADDIYHRLVYNGAEFTAISSLSDEIRKRTTVINGVSKTFAMTGWRIGLAVGDPEIISAMTKIASQTTSNPTAVAQYAAIEAFEERDNSFEIMHAAFEERLNIIYGQLSEVPGFELVKPNGAFYLFPKVTKAMAMKGYSDVTDFTTAILEEAGVALVTGAGFGSPENVRLSYATSLENLEVAVARLKDWMNE